MLVASGLLCQRDEVLLSVHSLGLESGLRLSNSSSYAISRLLAVPGVLRRYIIATFEAPVHFLSSTEQPSSRSHILSSNSSSTHTSHSTSVFSHNDRRTLINPKMQHPNLLARGLGLTSLCLLVLSALSPALAAPIPENGDVANAIVARANGDVYKVGDCYYEEGTQISQAEYEEYLNWNYKNKDKYVRLSFRPWASLRWKLTETGTSCSPVDPRIKSRISRTRTRREIGTITRT